MNKVNNIIERFNRGELFDNIRRFPSDEELNEAVKDDERFSDLWDLELHMIEIALNDKTHPYHDMVG